MGLRESSDLSATHSANERCSARRRTKGDRTSDRPGRQSGRGCEGAKLAAALYARVSAGSNLREPAPRASAIRGLERQTVGVDHAVSAPGTRRGARSATADVRRQKCRPSSAGLIASAQPPAFGPAPRRVAGAASRCRDARQHRYQPAMGHLVAGVLDRSRVRARALGPSAGLARAGRGEGAGQRRSSAARRLADSVMAPCRAGAAALGVSVADRRWRRAAGARPESVGRPDFRYAMSPRRDYPPLGKSVHSDPVAGSAIASR